MNATIRASIYDAYSLHCSRDETEVIMRKSIWWAKK